MNHKSPSVKVVEGRLGFCYDKVLLKKNKFPF